MKRSESSNSEEVECGVVTLAFLSFLSFRVVEVYFQIRPGGQANDRRQPVNDLMTMSRGPPRIDFGGQGGRQGLRTE